MITEIENFKNSALEDGVPEHDIEGMVNYVFHGIPAGSFLMAVFENDLMGAFGRADEENRYCLFKICSFIYNHFPHSSHGSPEKVDLWIKLHAQRRKEEGVESGNQN